MTQGWRPHGVSAAGALTASRATATGKNVDAASLVSVLKVLLDQEATMANVPVVTAGPGLRKPLSIRTSLDSHGSRCEQIDVDNNRLSMTSTWVQNHTINITSPVFDPLAADHEYIFTGE